MGARKAEGCFTKPR